MVTKRRAGAAVTASSSAPSASLARSSSSHNSGRRKAKNRRKNRRAMDPTLLLARGMSSRYLGSNNLETLTADEIDKDLRHMEAYANACVAYSQQYFIYHNQMSPTAAAPETAVLAMPVRIDPEEEKRLANLRKKIFHCEGKREVLESQYMSLRAHYVHISHVLRKLRKTVDARVHFLQQQVQKRGTVVALQRVRLQAARDVLECLNARRNDANTANAAAAADDNDDMINVWNEIEGKLKEAERDCVQNEIMQWEASLIPQEPPGVPLFLSQLSKAPGKGAAYGTNGLLSSKESSMCWLESNCPESLDQERTLKEEVQYLEAELKKERKANYELQSSILQKRKRSDELCTVMTLLRSETEAMLARHNVLLETPEARQAAQELHTKVVEERAAAAAMQKEEPEDSESVPNPEDANDAPTKTVKPQEDVDNYGDDEGGEDDEEGEILEG